MSPEQARGRDADRRSDLWAFGCVLYEMVTGHRAFDGEEVTDLIVAIVSRDPDWGRLPPDTPQPIQRLLRRCLVKSPKNRVADASVARIEIDDAMATPIGVEKIGASPATRAGNARWWMVPWAVAAIFATVAAALTARALLERSPRPSPVAFTVSLAEGLTFTTTGRLNVAISRDGSQIVYSANGRLFRRLAAEFDGRPIPGTDTAIRGVIDDTSSPAFSPDGTAIVFYAPDRTLKRIAAEGGTAVTVCAVEPPFGLIWDPSGIIVGQGARGIFRCGDNGGAPQQLVKVADGEEAYGPQMIAPDQMMFSVSAISDGLDRWDKARIVVQSLASGKIKTILQGGSDARYVTSGHLLFASGGTIMGVPFDAATQTVRGTPVPVLQGVRRPLNATTGVAQYGVSDTGTLVYVPGPPRNRSPERAIAKAAPGGTAQRLAVPPGPYVMVRATRDGRRLALASDDQTQATIIVAATDGNSSPQRLTFTGNNRYPVWSPDGRRLAFQSDRDGDLGIFVQNADGSGTERLTRAEPETEHAPQDWSPDGKVLLYAVWRSPPRGNANRGADSARACLLSMLTIATGATAVVPNVVAQDWIGAVFSPDGRWIAYRTDSRLDSGNGAQSPTATPIAFDSPNRGVFVQPFPPTGTRYQAPKVISDFHPVWTPDGESLVYIPSGASGQMAIAHVAKRAGLTFGVPSIIPALVTGNTTSGPPRAWDILADGSFIGPIVPDEGGSNVMLPQLRVVLYWNEQLERLSPAKER
jgi:Tol biopolymer transport system component